MSRQKCLWLKRQWASEDFIAKPITNKYLHRVILIRKPFTNPFGIEGEKGLCVDKCVWQDSREREGREIYKLQMQLLIWLHVGFN